MSHDEGPISLPTPEHRRLAERVGRWKVDCTYTFDPNGLPINTTARETIRLLGDLWCLADFDSDMMGVPFVGHTCVGYDPTRRQWVATWVDSMSPTLLLFEGTYDAAGKVLSMTAEAPDLSTGAITRYRTREELIGANERRLRMFVAGPDGTEFQISDLRYRRIP